MDTIQSFITLKKNCKKDMTGLKLIKVAVMGDCATQHLATAVKGMGYEMGYAIDILDTDYNQILPQLMDPGSETYRHEPAAVIIDMCSEKLYDAFAETELDARNSFAQNKYNEIESYWKKLAENSNAKIIQFNFPEQDDRVYGNFGAREDKSFIYQLRKLNMLMAEGAGCNKNVFICDVAYVQNCMGRDNFSDAKLYYAAKMPYSNMALPYIAREVVRLIQAFSADVKKCVVLDLDNTLWGGVVGDDGLEGIQIGELGIGHAFMSFQQWLKELTKRGIILAVCSKNDEDKAKEPFVKHPEMVLRLDDIAMFVANWEDKAGNIRFIRETLNIGMDSMVFIDDNPFERNLVREMIPEITVPEIPEDPAEYVTYLEKLNLFETISSSASDRDRTRQYKEEAGRNELKSKLGSYEDYLKELMMIGEAKPFDSFQYPRIAQLTQRSNQFNLRTVRYTEDEIAGLAGNDSYVTRYFTLRDKFGDHGLISVLIMEKQPEALFIDSLLMSCRVLKRGMEEFIMNEIVRAARECGYNKLKAQYIKTPKNSMVEHLYDNMGWTPLGDGYYELDADSYIDKNNYITKQ